MLININCRFFHNQQKKNLANFFRILQLSTRLPSSYDSHVGPFFPILQLCTCLPSSYDSDLGPFCSRQLRGLPSSDGYFFSLPEEMSTHQLLEIQSNTFSVEILSIPYRIYFKVMFQTDDHLFRDQWGTPNCQIEVYACLFILQLLPPWTHLIRACSPCTISIFRSNATEHVNWAYCGISRLVLAVDML